MYAELGFPGLLGSRFVVPIVQVFGPFFEIMSSHRHPEPVYDRQNPYGSELAFVISFGLGYKGDLDVPDFFGPPLFLLCKFVYSTISNWSSPVALFPLMCLRT